MKKMMLKAILTIFSAAFVTAVFYPLCVDRAGCDYLKLWLLAGIPFGVRRMFLWVMPQGFDIGGTVGVAAINFLVGGLVGGVVMAWQVGVALFILARGILCGTVRKCRRRSAS